MVFLCLFTIFFTANIVHSTFDVVETFNMVKSLTTNFLTRCFQHSDVLLKVECTTSKSIMLCAQSQA